MTTTPPALVIANGGLASTVACLLEAERRVPVVWVPPASAGLFGTDEFDHGSALACVQSQAATRGYAEVIDAGTAGTDASGAFPRLATPAALLSALACALSRGCERVVWPIACGRDLDALSQAAERAMLLSRIAWLEEGSLTGTTPDIETPLLDLTPKALAEMAQDLDAPAGFWLEPQAMTV